MKYKCPKCGNIVDDSSAFCSKCGTKLVFPKKEETPAVAVPVEETNVTNNGNKPKYDEANWKKQYEDLKQNDPTFKMLLEYNFRHALTYIGCAVIILIGIIVSIFVKCFTVKESGNTMSMSEVYDKLKDGSLDFLNNASTARNAYLIITMLAFMIVAIVIILELLALFLTKKEILRKYLVEGTNASIKSITLRVVTPFSPCSVALALMFFPAILMGALSYTALNKTYLLFEDMFPTKVLIVILVFALILIALLLVALFTWLKNSNKFVKDVKNGKIA